MTVSTTISKHVYNGNGSARNWEYTFPIIDPNDIEIYLTNPAGVISPVDANYLIDTDNARVIYPTLESEQPPLSVGYKLTLLRKIPLTQNVDLKNQGPFNAEVLEQAYDRLTMQLHQLDESMARAVKYPLDQNPSATDTENFLSTINLAKSGAETAASAASSSASSAASAAASAATAATNAASSASAAGTSASAASASQTAAGDSATAAAASATNAAASASTASTKASEAATSASNAASSSSSASTFASSALGWANNSASSATLSSQQAATATTKASEASSSATAAAGSATTASTKASDAATSATSAASSATAANTSATNAATSATNAANSATAAAGSATTATTKASEAATSATNAANSATAAATSETNAANSASAAAASAASANGIPTGTVAPYVGTTAPSAWLLLDGRTIGGASSGASARANSDTEALYTLLWGSFANTELPIQTSAGGAATRGASASADFLANKRLPLPNLSGRTVVGKDNMSGVAAGLMTVAGAGIDGTKMGAAGGAQTVTLTSGQSGVPAHAHPASADYRDLNHTHNYYTSINNNNSGGYPNQATVSPNTATNTYATGGANSSLNHNHGITVSNSTAQDAASAHTNTQPSIILTYIVKL